MVYEFLFAAIFAILIELIKVMPEYTIKISIKKIIFDNIYNHHHNEIIMDIYS